MRGFYEWHEARYGFKAGSSPPEVQEGAGSQFRRLFDALDEYSKDTEARITALESELDRVKSFLVIDKP